MFLFEVHEADESIKPGAQAPGSKQEKRFEPVKRETALSPTSRAQIVGAFG